MQNCLTACNFNLEFIYIFSGWEGSATDSVMHMFNDARLTDLHILPRKYYLADASFPSSCYELQIIYLCSTIVDNYCIPEE
jgi:hypothetical protein